MKFHSTGSIGVMDKRLPVRKILMLQSSGYLRSSLMGIKRVFWMKVISTLNQRGFSGLTLESK